MRTSGGAAGQAPRWARWAWAAQPAYLAVEVWAALALGVLYTLRDDTISALGTTCTYPATVVSSTGTVGSLGGCSSAPWVMNAAFAGFGLLQVVGASTLLGAGGRATLVGWLWVVGGVASVAVGALPVDRYPTAHAWVALPVFVAQPLALLLHPPLLVGRPARWVRWAGWALAAVSVTGAVAFVALLAGSEWVGAAERAAIWPAKVWLALAALTPVLAPGLAPLQASGLPSVPDGTLRPGEPRVQPPGPPRDGTPPATPPRG